MKVFISNNLNQISGPINNKDLIDKQLSILLSLISQNSNVEILDNTEQLKTLSAKVPQDLGLYESDLLLGVGVSGTKVITDFAKYNSKKYSNIKTVKLMRVEDDKEGYIIKNNSGNILKQIIGSLENAKYKRLFIFDDTIYSGMTTKWLLSAIPVDYLKNVSVICLRGSKKSMDQIRNSVAVYSGFEAWGELEKDITFINASGLIMKDSIRLQDGGNLAFYERKEWMKEWFTTNYEEIIAVCKLINELIYNPKSTEMQNYKENKLLYIV